VRAIDSCVRLHHLFRRSIRLLISHPIRSRRSLSRFIYRLISPIHQLDPFAIPWIRLCNASIAYSQSVRPLRSILDSSAPQSSRKIIQSMAHSVFLDSPNLFLSSIRSSIHSIICTPSPRSIYLPICTVQLSFNWSAYYSVSLSRPFAQSRDFDP
jgi:hypothetical protein